MRKAVGFVFGFLSLGASVCALAPNAAQAKMVYCGDNYCSITCNGTTAIAACEGTQKLEPKCYCSPPQTDGGEITIRYRGTTKRETCGPGERPYGNVQQHKIRYGCTKWK